MSSKKFLKIVLGFSSLIILFTQLSHIKPNCFLV